MTAASRPDPSFIPGFDTPAPYEAAAVQEAPHPRDGATGTKAAEPAPTGRVRDPYLDNAKFLAIILVVSGHLIEGLRDVPFAHAAYFYVYTFHMPLFITLSGYLSRNFTFSPGKARKLISGLAVPYVIFELAYSLPRLVLYGKLDISLLDPYYLTWFLMSLFMWRLSTPVWQQLRWPLAVAVGLSLMSGMSDLPDELSMNRTLGLLPFYVLGLLLRPEHFELLKRPWARVAGAAVLLAGLLAALAFHTDIATEWIRWRHGNAKIGVGDLTGSLIRLGMLAAGALLVAAFVAVTPSRRTWYSGLGMATMYAYLLHGFVVKIFEPFDHKLATPLGVALMSLFGVVLATVLCTPPVRRLFRWAVEPDTSWAFTLIRRPRGAR
ncbi:membrane protein [Sphaerisporangium krabiense]|uniref:Fucose 4-O-acetylase-like acetyltransferase n=1 Tax=Sphaerisporangium krabiense TaxID=763782 RepID=A0A7W8Z1J5_9ACTN|nr:acyltransferase family protein [Sphaerisporangium krabiense]MBB5625737.1 fucose 4-O-acetylase-like acetyltransferase [Sphaerisporangium krabiense]GII62926.1 membrane protein [Sphaerisporangium krabiense]